MSVSVGHKRGAHGPYPVCCGQETKGWLSLEKHFRPQDLPVFIMLWCPVGPTISTMVWLWWSKDRSNVFKEKVITVTQAAEKLLHSSVSASSSSTSCHCSTLSPTWFMFSGHWQGAVNKVYNSLWPPEGWLISLGEVTKAAVTGLKIAHVGTSALQPNSHTAGSRSVPGSQVAQMGVLMMLLAATCPGDKAAQDKACKWPGWASDWALTETLAGHRWHPFIHTDILKKPRQQKFLKWSLDA